MIVVILVRVGFGQDGVTHRTLKFAKMRSHHITAHPIAARIVDLDLLVLRFHTRHHACDLTTNAVEDDPIPLVFNEDDRVGMLNKYTIPQAQFDAEHWRGFSLRAYWYREALNDKK